MDADLKFYFKSLGFSDADISNLMSMEPALNIIDYKSAMDNIMVVVSSGYPMEDIDSLIAINPSFMVLPISELRAALSRVSGNVEQALKDDPFLI